VPPGARQTGQSGGRGATHAVDRKPDGGTRRSLCHPGPHVRTVDEDDVRACPRSSFTSSSRRTRLTGPQSPMPGQRKSPSVRLPEFPAFWRTQSPACRETNSLSNRAAVGGLMESIDSCRGSAPAGSGKQLGAGRTSRSAPRTRARRGRELDLRASGPGRRFRGENSRTPSLPTPAGNEAG
jgi:hypothetical protein